MWLVCVLITNALNQFNCVKYTIRYKDYILHVNRQSTGHVVRLLS